MSDRPIAGPGRASVGNIVENIQLVRGERPRFTHRRVFGHNSNIDIADAPVDVTEQGLTFTFLAAGATLFASSSDPGDTQKLSIVGLDANFELQEGIVTLAGETQVEVKSLEGDSQTWIRIYSAQDISNTVLAGDVYIATAGAVTGGVPNDLTTIQAKIVIGAQQSCQGIFTSPADHTTYITSVWATVNRASGGSNREADFALVSETFGQVFRILMLFSIVSTGSNYVYHTFTLPIAVPPKSDIKLVVTSVLSNSTQVSGGFDCFVVDDTPV